MRLNQKPFSKSRSSILLAKAIDWKAGRHLPHLDSWTKCNFPLTKWPTGVVMLRRGSLRKPSTEAFPDKVGGGGEAPLPPHSTLLAAGALLFILSTLAFRSLFALTYLQFGDRVSSCVRQWLCQLCFWPRLTWTWIASLLPPLTLRPAADQLFSWETTT